MTVHRNRVIYQSEALFISPDSTGAHFTGAAIANAENPADYANLAANVGPGPFGLFTPPTDIRQVHGGTEASPSTNNAKNLVGWQEGDVWPKWNPGCSIEGTFAKFQGNLEINNLTSALQIVADTGGPGLDTTVDLVFDGINDLNTIIATTLNSVNPAKQYTATAGGDQIFKSTTAGVVLTNGQAGSVAAQNRVVTWSGTGTVEVLNAGGAIGPADVVLTGDGNTSIVNLAAAYNATAPVQADPGLVITLAAGIQLTFIPGNNQTMIVGVNNVPGSLAYELVSVAESAAANAILFDADGILSIGALITAHNNNVNNLPITSVTTTAGTVMVVNELDFIPDAEANITFAGGVDPVFASYNGINVIMPADRAVSITATVRGAGSNITITGDGLLDIIALLAGQGAVDAGEGAWIPSNGEQIILAGGFTSQACAHGTIVKQLQRIQSANYGFTVTRQDVNQFGHMSRLDSIVVESPTVNLDFSYYLLDGYNERMLEFVTDGVTNALSGALSPELYQAGNNYFILTVPEARDAVNGDKNINAAGREDEKTVISLGNGYITDYSVDISVGAIPTASVTVEGMNIKSDFGETGNDVPAVDMRDGSYVSSAWDKNPAGDRISKGALGCTGLYSLPPASSGYDGCEGSIAAALRPGDVVVDLNNAGLISKQVSGDANSPLIGSAHVQSVSISVPMGRTTLQRLGSTFGFSKALDVPMTVTMSVSALLSEIKEGNMADLLCDCTKLDVGVKIYDPECVECVTKDEGLAMSYTLKGARLESENFTSTIGDNKTVDLTFTATIGGSDDPDNGLFISGKESSDATIKGFPPSWTGLNGRENVPASGLYMGYRS